MKRTLNIEVELGMEDMYWALTIDGKYLGDTFTTVEVQKRVAIAVTDVLAEIVEE